MQEEHDRQQAAYLADRLREARVDFGEPREQWTEPVRDHQAAETTLWPPRPRDQATQNVRENDPRDEYSVHAWCRLVDPEGAHEVDNGKRVPELPDVTIYLEALQSRLAGQTLRKVRLASPFVLRTVDPSHAT